MKAQDMGFRVGNSAVYDPRMPDVEDSSLLSLVQRQPGPTDYDLRDI